MKNKLKISVIVSVYNDIEALSLIIDSLMTQTYKDFEIIISEDCNTVEMKEFVSNYQSLNLVHIFQEDIGWRKNIALNNAIRKSKGNYLIFLDGDIIPYHNFVEMHYELAQEKHFLSGRRTELGPFFSSLIRHKKLSYRTLEKFYLFFFPFLIIDKARHAEEGFFLRPNSYLERKINLKKKKKMMLVGCNFSCFKKDLESINGFDEDYLSPSVGEDVDLSWRFNHIGITYKSVRYIANTFHLFHKRNWGSAFNQNNDMMNKKIKKKLFYCKNGLLKENK